MKILLCAYACHPQKGSEAGNSWNWAINLLEMGHEVWVLTGDRTETEAERIKRTEEAKTLARLRIVGVRLSPVVMWITRRGSIGVYLHYVLWLRKALHRARAIDRYVGVDVVHHVSWGSLMWGSPLWRLRRPFIFGPVGGGQQAPPQLREFFFPGWWKEPIRSMMIRRVLPIAPWVRATVKNSTLVLATNGETLQLVQQLGAARSRLVIDTAVPPSFGDAGRQPIPVLSEPLRIVWVGRLLPRKGLPLALEAVRRIGSDVRWQLTIVGGGRQSAYLPAMLRNSAIEQHVTYLGDVEWGAMASIYESSNTMLFTSLRDSSGSQLYEALAFGLPVIALDHHGQRDILPEAASIKVPIRSGDETAQLMAEALETVGRDPERRSRMSAAALQVANRNTWSAKVQDVYAELRYVLSSELGTPGSKDMRRPEEPA